MATIKRRSDRGNRWEVRYRDPDGKQRARLFERKVDAQRFVATTTTDILRGTYIAPEASRVTLVDYAATWTARMGPTGAHRRPRVSPTASISTSSRCSGVDRSPACGSPT